MRAVSFMPGRMLLLLGVAVLHGGAAPTLATAASPAPTSPASASSVRLGDAAYAQRAVRLDAEGRADPREVRLAVATYHAAIADDPGDLEAHWKHLRALHFEAEFSSASPEEKWETLERGTQASDSALAVLALRAGERGLPHAADDVALRRIYRTELRPEAARIHFYSALVWGTWSQHSGVLHAIRHGVVPRLRDHSRVVVALEPGLEGGGGHRFLANLHARLPRVPFLTGWVDRKRALVEAQRAWDIAPDHPANRLLLAGLLLDTGQGPVDASLAELRAVAALTPRTHELSEDLAIRSAARDRLAKTESREAGIGEVGAAGR